MSLPDLLGDHALATFLKRTNDCDRKVDPKNKRFTADLAKEAEEKRHQRRADKQLVTAKDCATGAGESSQNIHL